MQVLRDKYSPFYLFSFGIVLALLLPPLLQYGMFMDGSQYACVSMNLAEGKGSFWFPYLNKTWDIHNSAWFAEHPPLFYFFESQFFKVFGDAFYTEGIFCLCCAFANALLIHLIWKKVAEQYMLEKKLSWFPILLWITIPVCFWAFRNNMIEILMSVFDLLAVYFLLPFLFGKKTSLAFLFLSGICILGAALTKGVPGLFPLASIPLYYLSTKEITFKKALIGTFVHVLIPITLFLAIYLLHSEAHKSLHYYITERLLYRINNNPQTDNRFFIVGGLLIELLPALAISALLLLMKHAPVKHLNKIALFFILLGLSGVLPLMATLVQNRFYFVAALPHLAIGFALLNYSKIELLCKKIIAHPLLQKVFKFSSVILMVGSIIYAAVFSGTDSRDEELLNDARIIGKLHNNTDSLYAVYEAFDSWNFQFYLYRYYKLNIETSVTREYFVSNKKDSVPGYTLMPLNTKVFHVYKKIN